MTTPKLPDGPKTLPFLHLIQWVANPAEFLEKCEQRYGDCFTVTFTNVRNFVFISNPQMIEQIFTANPKQFDVGRAGTIIKPTVGDNSLILLDGDRHAAQRQLLMPPFHGERMRAYSQLIFHITQEVTNKWTAGETFTVRPFMQEISLKLILQAVFGLEEGQKYQQLQQLLTSFLEFSTSPFNFFLAFFPALQRDLGAWSPGGIFNRKKQEIDNIIYSLIEERRENPDSSRTDILSLLMSARDEAGQPMTDIELRDELITLLVAGHETTATAMTWALYWIHRLSEVKEKLLKEIETLGENPEANAITKLPYLSAVCSETLRIYPITLIAGPRIVNSPVEIMGYQYEPETMLAPCVYLTHQREDIYPEPKKFKPERFLERQFSPYEYLPFGGGNRRCIGAAFALFEMKLALFNIISNYQLELADNRPVKPVRRGVTMAPEGGVKMVMIGKRERREQISQPTVGVV
jgi:cytochrome P450